MRLRNWFGHGEQGAVGGTRDLAATSTPAGVAATAVRSAAGRLAVMALTGVAVGVAWAGQAVTTRHLPDTLSPLGSLSHIFSAYKNKSEISAALILLVAGACLLAAISLRAGDDTDDTPMLARTRSLPLSSAMDTIILLGVTVGLAFWGLFLWVLYDHHYHHPLNVLLLISVLLVAAPLLKRDFIDHRVRIRVSRWLPLHLLFLACVVGSFIYLNARDLRSWKYSAVGDEYNSFYYSLSIAKGAFFNPWSHRGSDDLGAVLGNAGRGLFMRIGNEDNFAWRFYDVVICAVALIPFYFLLRELFKPRVAVLGTIFFACSHYLFGYVHHVGYADDLLPTTLGLWLLVVGLKRDSSLALFGSGLALALGFYVFESGRAAVVVVSLFMLTFGIRAFRPAVFLPLAVGFIMLALPLFATDGPYRVFHQMFSQSAISYSSGVTGDRWHRLAVNAQLSFVSFNFSNAGRHYVWGSLADPLTAMLCVMGLGVVMVRVRRPAYRLLLIWWLAEIAFNGFSNPYPMVPVSRLQAAVPPVAALAAIAVDAIIRPFTDVSPWRRLIGDQRWNLATSSLAVAVLLPAVLSLNLYRFWYQMPTRFGVPTDEAVVVRAYRLPQCEGRDVVIVARDPLALLDKVFRSYNTNPMPRFFPYPPAIAAFRPADPAAATAIPPVGQPACIIVQRSSDGAQTKTVMAEVPLRFPDYRLTVLTDYSGLHQASLFTPASAGKIPSAP